MHSAYNTPGYPGYQHHYEILARTPLWVRDRAEAIVKMPLDSLGYNDDGLKGLLESIQRQGNQTQTHKQGVQMTSTCTRTRFYVGLGRNTDGEELSWNHVVNHMLPAARTHLNLVYTGYSEFQGSGGWKDDTGEIIEEDNVVFEVLHDLEDEDTAVTARELCTIFNQRQVLHTNEQVLVHVTTIPSPWTILERAPAPLHNDIDDVPF